MGGGAGRAAETARFGVTHRVTQDSGGNVSTGFAADSADANDPARRTVHAGVRLDGTSTLPGEIDDDGSTRARTAQLIADVVRRYTEGAQRFRAEGAAIASGGLSLTRELSLARGERGYDPDDAVDGVGGYGIGAGLPVRAAAAAAPSNAAPGAPGAGDDAERGSDPPSPQQQQRFHQSKPQQIHLSAVASVGLDGKSNLMPGRHAPRCVSRYSRCVVVHVRASWRRRRPHPRRRIAHPPHQS